MNIGNILANQHLADACATTSKSLFLPTWYEYLNCTSGTSHTPQLSNVADIWLILAAVIEILIRVAALAAVGIIIYAGIQYTTSSGNSEQTSRALNTIIYAAAGLAVCILAAVLVTFIAGSFKAT